MPPTGVALRDPRRALFDAAERIVLREGPSRLTSRDVTEEAGCAKGVLHRHFASFDTFLADFVLDRTAMLETQSVLLAASAGVADVVDTVVGVLREMLDPTRVRLVTLVTFRGGVRELLRERWLTGVPILADAALALAAYLRAERDDNGLHLPIAPELAGAAVVGIAYQTLADGAGAREWDKLHSDVAALLGRTTR